MEYFIIKILKQEVKTFPKRFLFFERNSDDDRSDGKPLSTIHWQSAEKYLDNRLSDVQPLLESSTSSDQLDGSSNDTKREIAGNQSYHHRYRSHLFVRFLSVRESAVLDTNRPFTPLTAQQHSNSKSGFLPIFCLL
uniref:DIX domain-containing protein n=1 Tax=Angiostrongylus cantonensis TaxID=6313 RepID=A0A0K0DJK6_ANGCA